MDAIALRIGGEKIYTWFIIAFGLLGAVFLGAMIGDDPINTIIVIASVIGFLAWLAMARKRWWLLMPSLGSLGGFFYFGFKIYPHELALLGCSLPLIISLALTGAVPIQKQRSRLPLAMYVLSAYLIAHWVFSNLYNREHEQAGFGNVSRAYFNALWVIFFLFAFRRYGSSKYLPAALILTYACSFFRVLATFVLYLSSEFAYIPVINYVLPGSAEGAIDLRVSGLFLGTVAMCFFLLKKGFFSRAFHGLVVLGSFVAVLLGAGRISVVLMGLVPIFAAVLYRKAIPVFCAFLAAGGFLLLLNTFPTVLDKVPRTAQRSASILLFDKGEEQKYGLALSSDIWHADLRQIGFEKLTKDWNSFIFGTGIRPFDGGNIDVTAHTTFEDLLNSSSKVGAYESGWWTVLAVTGSIGMILYLSVFFYLLRRLVPVLLREKVKDYRHAFAFMAVFNMIIWIGLGWTNGGFPSSEIMFGFLALFALQDEAAQNPRTRPVLPMRSVPLALTRPKGRRALQAVGR